VQDGVPAASRNRPVPIARRSGFTTGATGLSSADALDRLQRFGPNDVVETIADPWWGLVTDTLGDPMLCLPGDLVDVGPGEALPADAIVLNGSGLQADESTSTGESFPVAKSALTDGLDSPGGGSPSSASG
jgi:hypothetical protein